MKLLENLNLTHALEILINKLSQWFEAFVEMLPNLVLAITVFALFTLLSRFSARLFKKASHKFISNESLRMLSIKVIKVAVMVIGLFVALSILQLNKAVTSFLAGAGIVGIALGFAFQDTAANFMSGVLMAFRKPFKIGDIIMANGHMGTVKKIDFRTSIITTFQGQDVIVPNRKIYEEDIINYVANGERRIDLNVGVSYGDDLEKVEKIAVSAVKNIEGINGDRVDLFYNEFGSSSINFTMHLWIDYPDEPGYLTLRSKAIKAIKRAFDENKITIPFPIRTLDFGIKGGESLKDVASSQFKVVSK
jgi:small conductance mechanosensitive channel